MRRRKSTHFPKTPPSRDHDDDDAAPGSSRPLSESWAPNAEDSLLQKLVHFSTRRSLAPEFERALELFFNRTSAPVQILASDDPELGDFDEWYINDFALADGQRLIDHFVEEIGPKLPVAEAELLATWRQINRQRLFEVQSAQPGVGLVVRDLLSEEELTIYDRSASRTVRRWTVMLARTYPKPDRVCFTGHPRLLTPREKPELVTFARRLWETYRGQHPAASYAEFYRDHSLDLWHETKRLQAEAGRPPVFVTREGHPLVRARAEFAVHDGRAVAEKLAAAEEFEAAGPSTEHPGALRFDWFLRGRSQVPEQTDLPRTAVLIDLQAFPVGTISLGPQVRTLGDITLWPTRLELSCISRERLAVGKALLSEVLDNLVRPYKHDRIEPYDLENPGPAAGSLPPKPSPAPQLSHDEREALLRRRSEEHSARWLETPLPALEDLSPRQASQTPEGRAKVIDLIKSMEYLDDLRREASRPVTMDLPYIRRELGLPSQ